MPIPSAHMSIARTHNRILMDFKISLEHNIQVHTCMYVHQM